MANIFDVAAKYFMGETEGENIGLERMLKQQNMSIQTALARSNIAVDQENIASSRWRRQNETDQTQYQRQLAPFQMMLALGEKYPGFMDAFINKVPIDQVPQEFRPYFEWFRGGGQGMPPMMGPTGTTGGAYDVARQAAMSGGQGLGQGVGQGIPTVAVQTGLNAPEAGAKPVTDMVNPPTATTNLEGGWHFPGGPVDEQGNPTRLESVPLKAVANASATVGKASSQIIQNAPAETSKPIPVPRCPKPPCPNNYVPVSHDTGSVFSFQAADELKANRDALRSTFGSWTKLFMSEAWRSMPPEEQQPYIDSFNQAVSPFGWHISGGPQGSTPTEEATIAQKEALADKYGAEAGYIEGPKTAETEARISQTEAQTGYIGQKTQTEAQRTQTERARTGLTQAQTAKTQAQTGLTQAQTDRVRAQTQRDITMLPVDKKYKEALTNRVNSLTPVERERIASQAKRNWATATKTEKELADIEVKGMTVRTSNMTPGQKAEAISRLVNSAEKIRAQLKDDPQNKALQAQLNDIEKYLYSLMHSVGAESESKTVTTKSGATTKTTAKSSKGVAAPPKSRKMSAADRLHSVMTRVGPDSPVTQAIINARNQGVSSEDIINKSAAVRSLLKSMGM